MVRLEKLYLSHEEVSELSKEFYRNYDDDYWHAKLEMYEYLLENLDDVFSDSDSVEEDDLNHYERLLQSEVQYMFYHSIEALLGLVRSLTKGGIPWIDLKETRTHVLDEFVENELQEDRFTDEIVDIFYPGRKIEGSEQEVTVEDSANFIHRYLRNVGQMYGDRSVYNEYKHGLRLIVSEGEISMEFERDIEDLEDELLEKDNVEVTDDGIKW